MSKPAASEPSSKLDHKAIEALVEGMQTLGVAVTTLNRELNQLHDKLNSLTERVDAVDAVLAVLANGSGGGARVRSASE